MFRLRDWYVSNYKAMYKIYIVVFKPSFLTFARLSLTEMLL